MKKLNIRNAKKEDFEKLVDLQIAAWDYHHKNDALWSKSSGKTKIIQSLVKETFLTGRNPLALVLTCDDVVVGYATAEIRKKGEVYAEKKIGHIGTVFIDSGHRKLGLGKMAIDHFLEIFKKKKIKTVTLNVDIHNKLGIAAWRHMGFQDWRLELRTDI